MGELAVDVGLDLVEFGLVVVFGGQEAAVIFVGAVTMTMTMTTMTNLATAKGETCLASASYRPHRSSADGVGCYGPSVPIGTTLTPSGLRYA